VVRDRDGNPQEDHLAVHCFCVCSGSALLGDLLGVSRSMECDLLSVLLVYPRIFLHVFIVYRLLVGFLFYGRTLSDASMLYFADVFFYRFFVFFMAALVGQTAERIFTKLSHVVDIRCYL